MYITFIRSLLQYASEVWDGFTKSDMEQLEKVQIHAARIVTGLTIFSSRKIFRIICLAKITSWKTNKEIFTYIVKLVTSGIGTLKLMRCFVGYVWPKCYFFEFIIKIHKGTMNRKASNMR